MKIVNDQALGEISYVMLTKKEFDALAAGVKAGEDLEEKLVFAIFRKAYPEVTDDDFSNLPIDVIAGIQAALKPRISMFVKK